MAANGKTQPKYGEYVWKTWKEVNLIANRIAALLCNLELTPTYDDGKPIRVVGIWSKNRWEWMATMVSTWICNHTVSGFYDSMNDKAVAFIID